MTIEFAWKPGSRTSADAKVVGTELLRLTKSRGRSLSSREYVDEASNPSSPLHDGLNWNDADAADKYRLWQASVILTRLEFVDTDTKERVPVMLNVTLSDHGQRYVETSLVVSRSDLHDQVVEKAMRELQAWQSRYQDIISIKGLFSGVFSAIGKATTKVKKPAKKPTNRSRKKSLQLSP